MGQSKASPSEGSPMKSQLPNTPSPSGIAWPNTTQTSPRTIYCSRSARLSIALRDRRRRCIGNLTRYITNGQTDGSAGWGKSPTPLMPEVLRKLWETDRLPTWVARDAGLSDDTTLTDLGPEMWSKVGVAPERLKNYVIALVEARYDQIRNVPVLNRPWPVSLDPAVVPW